MAAIPTHAHEAATRVVAEADAALVRLARALGARFGGDGGGAGSIGGRRAAAAAAAVAAVLFGAAVARSLRPPKHLRHLPRMPILTLFRTLLRPTSVLVDSKTQLDALRRDAARRGMVLGPEDIPPLSILWCVRGSFRVVCGPLSR